MKKIVILTVFVLGTVGCSNFYSPMGVKGKDAKKQITELNSNLSLASFPLILSAASSSSSSTFVCPVDSSAVLGSSNANSGGAYTLPAIDRFVDLDARAGGTLYFRSGANSGASTGYTIKVIQTSASSGSTATCTYISSAAACTDASLVGSSFSSSTTATVAGTHCLAIRCTTAGYIRIQPSTSSFSTSSSTSSTSFLSLALSPAILEETSGIEDDKYYTKESLDKCKEGLTTISLFQSSLTASSVSGIREVTSCNKPYASIATSIDSSGIAALQGNECKLEEVNFIGF